MQRILAASDFSTRSQRAVRRAGLLAQQNGAELTLLHVVDDDQPAHLVELERSEAGRILNEQIASVPELRGVACRFVVTMGDAFDAILRTAETTSADLIVMGAHRRQLLRDIFVGTTIERVVRMGSHPVLMVNMEAAHPYARVLAAVDMSDASARAMKSARSLGFLADAHLCVVHAFEALAKSYDVPCRRPAGKDRRLRCSGAIACEFRTDGVPAITRIRRPAVVAPRRRRPPFPSDISSGQGAEPRYPGRRNARSLGHCQGSSRKRGGRGLAFARGRHPCRSGQRACLKRQRPETACHPGA